MAHEITRHDKVLAYRTPTWHGLEDLLSERPTREEAEKHVHDWHVQREPLYRKNILLGEDNEVIEEYELIPEFELNVRSDIGLDLAVVPADRPEYQPNEVWDIAELLQGDDKNIQIETAGSLREGRDIWILLKLNEPIEIQGDGQGLSLPYYALQNSYVPGSAFRGQASNVRLVCANTSRATDLVAEAHGTNFAFSHRGNMRDRVEEARDAIAGWRESIKTWQSFKEHMATIPVNADQTNWFIDNFIEAPHDKLTSDRVKENIETARLELITELYGGMNQGITGTALGLFEAASSWNEHVRAAQSPLTRFKRSMLSPDSVLSDARALALEAATVS